MLILLLRSNQVFVIILCIDDFLLVIILFVFIYLFVSFCLFVSLSMSWTCVYWPSIARLALEAIMSIKDWRLINMPSLTTTILITAAEIYNNTSWAWSTDFCILWDAYHAYRAQTKIKQQHIVVVSKINQSFIYKWPANHKQFCFKSSTVFII